MIEADKRKAIYLLNTEGMGIREIARRLGVSINTVSVIIEQQGIVPEITRKDKTRIDSELLIRLYQECEGFVERIHEKLNEEEGIAIGYSTLTRMVRDLNLGKAQKRRCEKVDDVPGAEMQHDTSPYQVKIAERSVNVVGSLLYFRYSKIRYLKFYRSFNRFKMKCFFHEALLFWGYAAKECIIDNTNLARLRGTGKNAVIVPEMEKFAKQYGFELVCHEKGHANRKAGDERGFYTVETNFFPGRKFMSHEDLNQQAFDWATVRSANRPVGKARLIPAKVFEFERGFLQKLPPFLHPPYLFHKRGIDQYGYIPFNGNFYWIPGDTRHDVTVLEYSESIKTYHHRKLLAEYKLPPEGTKNQPFWPEGFPRPSNQPKDRKKPSILEENKLRATAEEVEAYLTFLKNQKGIQWHRLIRALYGLSQKMAMPLFVKTIQRALKYRISDIRVIERMAVLQMTEANYQMSFVSIDDDLDAREAYREGLNTGEVDLSVYDQLIEDDDG
jgi:transposase